MDKKRDSAINNSNPVSRIRTRKGNCYELFQVHGQRKYGGPPPDWGGKPAPEKGSEIFIGTLPRDCFEEELIPLLENIGTIYEFRLMMDFSGSNRGYAFCTYTCKQDVQSAIRRLNNYEIRRGRFLGVCASVDNCRLFIRGIPQNKKAEEFQKELEKVTEGVVKAILYPSVSDKTKNRGYGFVEYRSHHDAVMARRKLIPGRLQLWGQKVSVDWAEPEVIVDEEVMAKVRILFVRHLMLSTTEETLKEMFEEASGVEDSVYRVKKNKDFAFIHFRTRESAEEALSKIIGVEIDGSKVEVTWSKPSDKNDLKTLEDILPKEDDIDVRHFISNLPQAVTMFERGHNVYDSPIAWSFMQDKDSDIQCHSCVYNGAIGQGRCAAGLRGAGALYRSYMHAYLQNTYKRYREMVRQKLHMLV